MLYIRRRNQLLQDNAKHSEEPTLRTQYLTLRTQVLATRYGILDKKWVCLFLHSITSVYVLTVLCRMFMVCDSLSRMRDSRLLRESLAHETMWLGCGFFAGYLVLSSTPLHAVSYHFLPYRSNKSSRKSSRRTVSTISPQA